MKTRIKVSILLILGIIAFYILYFDEKSKLTENEQKEENNRNIAPSTEQQKPRAQRLKDIVEQSNVQVNFWGEVFNQYEEPVEGALVRVNIRRGNINLSGNPIEQIAKIDISTNHNGRFSILNNKGSMLSIISIEKQGHEMASRQNTNFDYFRSSNSIPTSSNPQRFTLIQDVDSVHLSFTNIKIPHPWDGTPVQVDLRNGDSSDSADIVIIANKGEIQGRKYDWTLTINVPNGGIYPASDSNSVTIAPSGDVYVRQWSIAFDKEDPEYKGGLNKDFFIRQNDGIYSRIKMIVAPDIVEDNTSNIIMRVFINESGDRVLEDKTTNSKY